MRLIRLKNKREIILYGIVRGFIVMQMAAGEYFDKKVMSEMMVKTIYRKMGKPKIVDIGCNIGELFGDKAVNVDRASFSDLRKESGNEKLEIPNFVQADAEDLPFEDFSFDLAYLGEILEHVDDPLVVLNEAQRVAHVIVFTVPNESEWDPRLKPFTNSGHKRVFDETMVIDLINDSDLKLIEYMKLGVGGWSHFIVRGVSKHVELSEWS